MTHNVMCQDVFLRLTSSASAAARSAVSCMPLLGAPSAIVSPVPVLSHVSTARPPGETRVIRRNVWYVLDYPDELRFSEFSDGFIKLTLNRLSGDLILHSIGQCLVEVYLIKNLATPLVSGLVNGPRGTEVLFSASSANDLFTRHFGYSCLLLRSGSFGQRPL